MKGTRSGTILLAALLACAPASDQVECHDVVAWTTLLEHHLSRYPEMEMTDALKLLQQAVTGSEHAATDSANAAAWMRREWAGLGAGPPEPLIDTLGLQGGFARIHLRPYRDAGGEPARLTALFLATSRAAPDTARLGCVLNALSNVVPWDAALWRDAVARWRAAGFPAKHHSAGYEAAYLPAYRIVKVTLAGAALTPTE